VRCRGLSVTARNLIVAPPMWYSGAIQTWLASYTTASFGRTANGNPHPIAQFGMDWHGYGWSSGAATPLAVITDKAASSAFCFLVRGGKFARSTVRLTSFLLITICAFRAPRVSSRIARKGKSAVDPFLPLASGSYKGGFLKRVRITSARSQHKKAPSRLVHGRLRNLK
jgi:hypothetical protein